MSGSRASTLARNLSIDRLSQVANFSKFHFHRQFSSYESFGIAYDGPDTVEPAAFRFDICGSVAAEVRCGVLRHPGSHDRIGESARYLYREWLPASGEELRDFPLFFHYLNLKPETPEHELITDIYLPLK
jgi:AraC family transcriptional regulator